MSKYLQLSKERLYFSRTLNMQQSKLFSTRVKFPFTLPSYFMKLYKAFYYFIQMFAFSSFSSLYFKHKQWFLVQLSTLNILQLSLPWSLELEIHPGHLKYATFFIKLSFNANSRFLLTWIKSRWTLCQQLTSV